MTTKLGKMATYLDEILPIKLHHPTIALSCKIKWQLKVIVSQLPQCLWLPNLASLANLTCNEGLPTMLLHPLVKCFWLYISSGTLFMTTRRGRMVTYLDYFLLINSKDHIITWFCEITCQTKNISTTTMPMATKIGRKMTNLKWLLLIKSHDHI